MVVLTISLLTKFQKADFPDKNVLITSFFFLCQDIWVSGGFFFSKMSVFKAYNLHNEDRSE